MEPVLGIFQTIALPLLGMLALVVIGWFVASTLRAWSRRGDDHIDEGFTLEELRRLKREGAISDDEYARATGKMLAGAAVTGRKPAALASKSKLRAGDRTGGAGATAPPPASNLPGSATNDRADVSIRPTRPVPPKWPPDVSEN
jgi:hypothetical protein